MKIEDLVEIHLSQYSDKFCIYTEKELKHLNDVGVFKYNKLLELCKEQDLQPLVFCVPPWVWFDSWYVMLCDKGVAKIHCSAIKNSTQKADFSCEICQYISYEKIHSVFMTKGTLGLGYTLYIGVNRKPGLFDENPPNISIFDSRDKDPDILYPNILKSVYNFINAVNGNCKFYKR